VEAAALRLQRTQITAQVVRHLELDDLAAVAEIERHLEWVQLASGEWLFREGDIGDAAYLVATGRLRVVRGPDDQMIGEIGRGELVGEMALIEGGTRNASVCAIRDTQLVRFPEETVSMLVERFPQVFLRLTRTILRRVRQPASLRAPDEQLSVAVVPISPNLDIRALDTALAASLGGVGTVAHLWSDRVDEMLGGKGVAQSRRHDPGEIRLVQWLAETEDRSRFMILEADPEWSPWTERVLRQADRVLFVGDARGADTVGPLETNAIEALRNRRRPRTSLVLIHPTTTKLPASTSRWLEARSVDEVFHVRERDRGDIERLARVLAGRAVSLVLSGGGARGYAHLGVIRAMNELGIPIDSIGGTSIGSVVASGPPMDRTDDEMVSDVEQHFKKIMDWTLPLVSVISGKRISAAIVRHYGGIDIEDLWLPYFCISASLTRARAVVHRRGSLATAVRASIAIPGVLPPVPFGDELLVDGGVIDNLPVPEARRDNVKGSIIAVDVAAPSGPRAKFDYGLSMSGWRALGATVRGRGSMRLPMLHGTVLGSMLIASTRDRDRVINEGLADLYLSIDARGCRPFEWDAVRKIADVGYATSRERLAAWADESGSPWRLG
jgi:predicted acylesterase/phospholipase RssA